MGDAEVDVWECERNCTEQVAARIALEQRAPPILRGVVVAEDAHELTLEVRRGAPTGSPHSVFYVPGRGTFRLGGAHPGARSLRLVPARSAPAASPAARAASRAPAPAFVLGMSEIGLAVTRALGRRGVPVLAFERRRPVRPPGFGSRYCRAAITVPDPLRDPAGALRLLVREARGQAEKPVLFFTDDPWVDFVARERAALREHFRFSLPPEGVVDALLDKRRQVELARRAGVPCPRTFFPETREDALAVSRQVDYPAFIKPRVGHLWRLCYAGEVSKGFRVDGPGELVARFEEVLAGGFEAIVQSVVLGPATNILIFSGYVDRSGALVASHTGRKLRQYPPEFGNTALCESVPLPELVAHAKRLLDATGYRGFAGIEMKRDERDGQLKFIELNARPELFHAILLSAGVDLTTIEYRDLCGLPPGPIPSPRYGVRWWNAVDDVKSFALLHRRGQLSWRDWVRSWAGARSFAVLAADDPLPALRYLAARVARVLGRRAPFARLKRPAAPAISRAHRGAPGGSAWRARTTDSSSGTST